MGDFSTIALLREANMSKVSESIDALNQWILGNELPLREKFPGEYYLLVICDVRILHAAINRAIDLRKEAAERPITYFHQLEIKKSLDQTKSDDATRSLDIISRNDDLLKVEFYMMEQGILDHDKHFIPNHHRSNKRCLAGIYKLLYGNGYFKKFVLDEDHRKKRISRTDVYRFLNQRYGIKQFQELKRKNKYEELAMIRVPMLK